MPTPTYDLIASSVIGFNGSPITFSSLNTIAAGYRDLIIVINQKSASGNKTNSFRFNGDSGANYSYVYMRGNGSTASSFGEGGFTYAADEQVSSTDTESVLTVIQIMDFSATDKHKTALIRSNRAGQAVVATAIRWANTSAITSVSLGVTAGDYAIGSSFYLYGISS